MEKGLISVLMPAFNAEKFIEQAVDSVLSQTYEHFELLVADDLSTDGTTKKLNQFSDARIRLLPNDEKLGYTKTCNRLFRLCKGNFIAFQDADDYSHPERFAKQLEQMHTDSELMMCGTGVFIVTENGRILDEIHRSTEYKDILQALPQHNQFIGSTIMIRKKVYDHVGGYRPEFSKWGNQDYDWAYRVCEKYKAKNLPEALYYYRQNIHSNSKKVSEIRAIGPAIVQYLGNERRLKGSDLLMQKDIQGIAKLEKVLLWPFMKDSSLIYYRHAQNRIYIHQYHNAFQLIIQSITKRPWSLRNYLLLVSLTARMGYRFFKFRGRL